jgi:hypothetical protein
LIRIAVVLVVLVVGVQIGLYKGRSQEADKAFAQVATTQDRQIEMMKEKLYEAQKEARKYRLVVNILNCESGIRHDNVWGDGGRSYGIAQFQKSTFSWMRDLAQRPKLQWKSRHDQIELLSWAIENGYEKYWTCYDKVKKEK